MINIVTPPTRSAKTARDETTVPAWYCVPLSLHFVAYWPFVYLGEGKAGIAIVFGQGIMLSCALAHSAYKGRLTSSNRSGLRLRYLLITGYVIAALAATSTISERTSLARCLYLLLVSVPSYVLATKASVETLRRAINFWATLFSTIFAVYPALLPNLNPISRGHIGALVVLCTLGSSTNQTYRIWWFGRLILGAYVLFSSPSLGPLVGIGFGTFAYLSQRNRTRFGKRPALRTLVLFGAVSAAGVACAKVAIELTQSDSSGIVTGSNSRMEIWGAAIDQFTLLGNGATLLKVVPQLGASYQVHAHNWILDAAVSGGLLGLALASIFAVDLARWVVARPIEPFLVSYTSGLLVSGGFMDSPAIWTIAGVVFGATFPTVVRHFRTVRLLDLNPGA